MGLPDTERGGPPGGGGMGRPEALVGAWVGADGGEGGAPAAGADGLGAAGAGGRGAVGATGAAAAGRGPGCRWRGCGRSRSGRGRGRGHRLGSTGRPQAERTRPGPPVSGRPGPREPV